MKRILFTIGFLSFFVLSLSAQEGMKVSFVGGRNFIYRERTDLRRYDNNKYTGLTSREVRSFMSTKGTDQNGNQLYDGNFYVLQKTVRNKTSVAKGINAALPASFSFSKDGSLNVIKDCGYPSFRSFPQLPEEEVKPGDTWSAKAWRITDPLDSGNLTEIPMYVTYRYERKGQWNNQDVYVISASWTTRYVETPPQQDDGTVMDEKLMKALGLLPENVPDFTRLNGSHNATLYISVETGAMLVCQDKVDETYVLKNGQTITFKGNIALFTDYASVVNRQEVKNTLTFKDIGFTETASGLMLTLENLQFESNTANLLPGEASRLDKIAAALKKAPGSIFLVTGHAAAVGTPEEEMELSIQRACTITKELISRGIDSDYLMYRGLGSTTPIADNATPEGRAKNRRVEITILE